MYLDEGERRPGRDRDALGPRVPVEGSQPWMMLENTAVGSCSIVRDTCKPVVSKRGRGEGSRPAHPRGLGVGSNLAVKVPG